MFVVITSLLPGVAGLVRKAATALEVILHIGAHRTGTTTLQRALTQNAYNLRKSGITVWTPGTTRAGLFDGLMKNQPLQGRMDEHRAVRSAHATLMEIERLARTGQHTLIISDENFIGSMRQNLDTARLYPFLRQKLARFETIVGGLCSRLALAVRGYDGYWGSSLGHGITMGDALPEDAALDRLVTQPRNWTRIIGDVARTFPNARICVWRFEDMIGRTAEQMTGLLGQPLPAGVRPFAEHHNAAVGGTGLQEILVARGDSAQLPLDAAGRYQPFEANHQIALADRYAEDTAWLALQRRGQIRFIDAEPRQGSRRACANKGTRG